MKKILVLFAVIILLMLGLAIWQDQNDLPFVNYQVIATQQDYEIRSYPELLIAEDEVDNARNITSNHGFSVLTNYVHGANATQQKINILLPVMQYHHGNVWSAMFVLSNQYELTTLPKPTHSNVVLQTLPAKKYIVMRFSGVATQNHVERHLRAFEAYLLTHHIRVVSGPILAFYNTPWTLPFIRRNEIMFALSGK